MGFEINGMPVLTNAHGFVNQTNIFKTMKGQNIQGSGNITDTGSDVLEYNKVGSFTLGNYTLHYLVPGRSNSTPRWGWLANDDVVPATEINVSYSSNYGGYCTTMSSSGMTDDVSFTKLSGTWKHKSISYGHHNNGISNKSTLWQRVA